VIRRGFSDLLSHLYVLVPVLDSDKHYWVSQDEVDKLIRHSEEARAPLVALARAR